MLNLDDSPRKVPVALRPPPGIEIAVWRHSMNLASCCVMDAAQPGDPYKVPLAATDLRSVMKGHWAVGDAPFPADVLKEAQRDSLPVKIRHEIPVSLKMSFRLAQTLPFGEFSERRRHVTQVPLPPLIAIIAVCE